MNRIVNMILRNLRTEIEQLEKGQEELVALRAENAMLKTKLKQQEMIDSLTNLQPVFKCKNCGWLPLPGSVVHNDVEKQTWECPICQTTNSSVQEVKQP